MLYTQHIDTRLRIGHARDHSPKWNQFLTDSDASDTNSLYAQSIEKIAMSAPTAAQELALLLAKFSGIVTMTGIGEILAVLQQHDISTPRFAVLKLLDAKDGATVSIAYELGLTVGSTSQLIDRLEVDGLVQRVEDESDRRIRRIYLHDRGAYLIEQLKTLRRRQMEDLMSNLPHDLMVQLSTALTAVFPYITKEVD
jgi:DNA-binding MarR family transcriptional regulator